ncbi:MAG: ATP-dependent helicase, partial [Calditrichaeota bacterium]|nr:ATP-dependent helicase [Calditrichota bacterium]
IVFTQDNDMAYRIGKRFFLPVLTHHTKLKEREAFLENFREGRFNILVTSKVLNEGVDVPEANVAIIVSGSGSVREHVQRLGRILRARPGKEAMLYELVSKDTGEHFINQRRRKHDAYQGPGSL